MPFFLRFPLTVFVVTFFSLAHGASISSISQEEWSALNATVSGRLYAAEPLGKPCFGSWKQQTLEVDVDGCKAVQKTSQNGVVVSNKFGSYSWSNFAACMATAETCALQYSNVSANRQPVSKTCNLGSIPNYYIDVSDVSDIQAGLKFAREKKIPLVVKNSGHDHKGRSSGPGSLGLWMNNHRPALKLFRKFVPLGCNEPVGDAITMGAGIEFKTLYQFAEKNNVTVVGGSDLTVRPAGGWMTGGGHSTLTNTLGLGVDNVVQIKTVLPNGTYITANRCQNQDMFFALRGGGGNAFGVNMKVTTLAHPQKKVQYLTFSGSAKDRASFRELLHILASNSNKWASSGWGGTVGTGLASPFALNLALHNIAQNNSAAREAMSAILALKNSTLFKRAPSIYLNETYSTYSGYQKIYPGGDGILNIGVAISSRLVPRSSLETPAQQETMTDAMLKVSDMFAPDSDWRNPITYVYHYPVEFLLVTPYNYKPSTDPSDAVSVTPAWRNATWHVVLKEGFMNDANRSTVLNAYRKAYDGADLFRKIAPASGAYQSEADLFEPDAETAFWGPQNYQRLVRLKRQIDPDNLLTCWQCVGYDRTDPRYSCYPDFHP